jgi:hypothetical protein
LQMGLLVIYKCCLHFETFCLSQFSQQSLLVSLLIEFGVPCLEAYLPICNDCRWNRAVGVAPDDS